jgi:hypothetical protein
VKTPKTLNPATKEGWSMRRERMRTQHALGVLHLLVLLAACGQTPAGEALRMATEAPAEAPEARAEQGPSLLLQGPRQVVLVPASGSGARQVWRGPGQVALATDGARVVGTAGLAQMVMATRFDGADPLEDVRALSGQEARARRTIDLAGPDRDPGSMRFGLVVDCTLRGRAEAGWVVVEERCDGDVASFTNRFWADPATGIVWRSEQWAGDGVPMLTVQRRGI